MSTSTRKLIERYVEKHDAKKKLKRLMEVISDAPVVIRKKIISQN